MAIPTSMNDKPCQYCNYMTNAFAYVYWHCEPLYVCCYCAEMMDMLTLWSNGQFATRVDDGDINGN
jgi:hypothetical protein